MGPEVVIGIVSCLLCTLCSCFCLAAQEEQRRKSQGLPPALCCLPGGSSNQYPQDELLYSLQLQENANAQADRAARLDAYIERRAKSAAENWLKAQSPIQQPLGQGQGQATSGSPLPGIPCQIPSRRMGFLSPRVPAYFGQPGCQCANTEPYNPNTPYHGKIIYDLR